MRLLYLSHQVPFPPDKGEKIRAYYQLAHLGPRHRVHLACFASTEADLAHARRLEEICASVDVVFRSPRTARLHALTALATGRSLSVAAYDSGALRARVLERFRDSRPDVVVAYSAAMAQYVEGMNGPARVLDFVDADSEKWRAYGKSRPFPQSTLYALEGRRLARYEAQLASTFDASIFVSEAEADIVRRAAPGRELIVIRNGVDLDAFRPEPDHPRGPILVFTGVMNYYPNEDAVSYFAKEVLPAVRARVPDAQFWIVGREPSATVSGLSRLPGVRVTGSVPDVRPYLAEAAVAVAPFRIARGVQNKVLEAMASGLPVVGTPVAFQSLAAGADDGIRAADSVEGLAAEVCALLTDPRLREELGRRARAYVERHHRWEDVGALLESALLEAVARHGAATGRAVAR